MAEILALGQNGNRLIPLVSGAGSPKEAHAVLTKQKASELFPRSAAPEAALAGLWVYFSFFDQGHAVAQEILTAEGSFWHGVLHRQEPDAGNAAYWFRQVGPHPVFGELAEAADRVTEKYPEAGFQSGKKWDPFAFIDFCERARRASRTSVEQAALEIQRAEWQLLFDYCARPRS